MPRLSMFGLTLFTCVLLVMSSTNVYADQSAETEGEVVELVVDDALDLELESCLEKADESPKLFRRCLAKIANHPDTVAGYEAATIEQAFRESTSFGTGQIELTSVASLFGLWNGAAFSLAALSFADEPGDSAFLIVGASALAFGVGYGVGGSLLGKKLKLDVGQSRLTASGLVWGTVIGLETLPLLNEADLSGGAALALPLLAIVSTGFLGGGAALYFSRERTLDRAQVSLFNTGGGLGTFVGLAFVLAAEFQPAASTITLLSTTSAGLAGGILAGQLLEMTWGQTLLIDFGAIGGAIAFGSAAFFIGAQNNDLPPIFFSAMVSAGALGGAAAAGVGVNYWGKTPVLKDSQHAFGLAPTLLIDHEDNPVFGLAAYGVTF